MSAWTWKWNCCRRLPTLPGKRPKTDEGRELPAMVARRKRRPRRLRARKPALNVPQILAWADAHFTATGRWPKSKSGPVLDTLGETWLAVDKALMSGGRGLSGGRTLAKLLSEHRSVPHQRQLPRLT